jgi:phosphocarrier protein
MKQREVVIGHRLGLHARAAAKLVQLSTKFKCNIVLFRPGANEPLEADARSILSILFLSAGPGSKLGVRADGEDEDQALESICDYLAAD